LTSVDPRGAAVSAALEAAGALVPCDELAAAWAARAAPPVRMLLFGRRSVGKTSIANAWTGDVAPTGLGGATPTTRIARGRGLVVLDPPGAEHAAEARAEVARWLPWIDVVVWVVDGLMPATAIEREILDAAVPPGVALDVRVARADLLEPTEIPAIEERLRALVGARGEVVIRPVDARAPGPPPAAPPWARSPHRTLRIREGLVAARAALAHLPGEPPVGPALDEAAAAWRDGARAALAILAREAREGRFVFSGDAAQALHAALVDAAEGVDHGLRARVGLALPWRPTAPAAGFDLRRMLGGASATVRALREIAAAAAADGEVAIRALAVSPDVQALQRAGAARDRAHSAVDAALDALPGIGRPDGISGAAALEDPLC
jgi:hypothetical protein